MIVERRLLKSGAGILALLAAGTFFFWPILIAGRIPVFRDILDTTVPLGHYIGARLRQGQLPQWFPYEGLGEPFIGQLNESTFHPATWLFAVLPLAAALRLELLLGYLAAAFGQSFLARQLGISRTGSALAAVAFTFSGYAISLGTNLPYLWGMATLPWLGLCAVKVCTKERPWPWVSALALLLATIVLAGDSHSAFFGGLVALLAAAHTRRWRRLPLCGAGALIAIGLAAAELLPAIDIVREGPRASWMASAGHLSRYWALHPHRLPELLLPGWLPSRPAHILAARLGESGMWASSIYAGAPIVVLAVLGLFSRARTAILAGGLALLGLWLATGSHGGLEPVARHLPLLNLLRYPEKYLGIFTLALPLAAAAGLDQLRARQIRTAFVATAGGAAAFAFLALLLPGDAALRIWAGFRPAPQLVAQLHDAWHGALVATALSLAGTAAILLGGRRRPILFALLPLLAFLDLWQANGAIIATADPGFLKGPPRFCVAASREGAALDGLRVVNTSTRLPTTEEATDPVVWAVRSLNEMVPAENVLCGIGSIWSNSVLSNEPRWVRWAIGTQHLEESEALILYGFGFVVRTQADPPARNETLVDSLRITPEDTLLLARRPAAPRVYAAVPRWVPDGVAALREVQAHGLGLVESPVLAGEGPQFSGTGKAGEVHITTYEPEHVVLDAQLTRPGAVVLNDLAARGWTATVDGSPARIYRANVLVRGVLVGAGRHRIEMSYSLPGLRAGLGISAASLLLCLLLACTGLRRRGSAGDVQVSQPA